MRARLPQLLRVALLALAAETAVATQQPPPNPTQGDLLARAYAYVDTYERTLSAVVAEERYEQIWRSGPRAPVASPAGPGSVPFGALPVNTPAPGASMRRSLVSDLLLVSVGKDGNWVPFRDVYEVDGTPVRDRTERLTRLFLESPATAFAQATRIKDESARYNIGPVTRTLNVPTFGLLVLTSAHRSRFTFMLQGTRVVDGARVALVRFVERDGPTLIVGTGGASVRIKGDLLIGPDDGHVVRTSFEARERELKSLVTVNYRHQEDLRLWLPAEMRERYEARGDEITGTARYSHFRTFRVETTEFIK